LLGCLSTCSGRSTLNCVRDAAAGGVNDDVSTSVTMGVAVFAACIFAFPSRLCLFQHTPLSQ